MAWFKIPRASGANDAWLIVTADSNFTADRKTGKITVTGQGVTPFEIAVSQIPGVTPTANVSFGAGRLDSISFGGANIELTITNSLAQRIAVSSSQPWLMVSNYNPLSYYISLSVSVDENTEAAPRTGKITIKNKMGETIKEYTITQHYDAFGALFYGKKWGLDKAYSSSGSSVALPDCQKGDQYTFSSNNMVSVKNMDPNGMSCSTSTNEYSYQISLNGSTRSLSCSQFYAFASNSTLNVSSISADKLVLEENSGFRYEFVRMP